MKIDPKVSEEEKKYDWWPSKVVEIESPKEKEKRMMTRKHFKLLAATLKEAHPGLTDHDTAEARKTWSDVVTGICDVCEDLNSNFDRSKFINACVPAGRCLVSL